MPQDDKTPTDHLLDLLVYGPLGFALEAEQLVPRLVERGRATLDSQVGTARVLGQVVVAQGRRELDRQVERLRANLRGPGPTATDTTPTDTTATDTTVAPEAPTPTSPDPSPPAGPRRRTTRPTVAVVAPESADAAEEEHDLVLDGSRTAVADSPRHDAEEAAALAIPDYDSLAASQVVPRLAGLTAAELEAVRRYEAAHRARRTILARVGQLQAGR